MVQAATAEFGPDRDTSIVATHLRGKARDMAAAGSRKGSNS